MEAKDETNIRQIIMNMNEQGTVLGTPGSTETMHSLKDFTI